MKIKVAKLQKIFSMFQGKKSFGNFRLKKKQQLIKHLDVIYSNTIRVRREHNRPLRKIKERDLTLHYMKKVYI